ncbi:hypothetical protein GALL_497670 [mine drainage metagenome]|uniref:Uncharacterized protein n=1 Tax=mine drainage metagenome TaxID=410659 RepID=A0A1J5PYD0_9ZZZZ
MDDRKIFLLKAAVTQRVGALIGFTGSEVEINAHALAAMAELEHIGLHPAQQNTRGNSDRFVTDDAGFQKIAGRADLPESKGQFEPHHAACVFG